MKPFRILQLCNRIPWPLNDGGNIATYNVTKYLHFAGCHVEMACLNTSKHRQDPKSIQVVDAIHAVEIDTSVTAFGALKGLWSSTPYNIARFWSEDFARLLREVLRKGQFDLVQLEGSYMSLYCHVIKEETQAPIILRSHNVEHQIWDRLALNEPQFLKRLYLKHLAKGIRRWESEHLQDCDAIVPITARDESTYRELGFTRPMRTINAGVDFGNYSPKHSLTHNFKIGFLGSLEWRPNVEGLLWWFQIWPQIRALDPRLELHVAGKNPDSRLQAIQLEGMVFHGEVPDASEFMESCHFFIVPLLSGGGMRLKVVEAMAMGRCVVATTIGAEGVEAKVGEELLIADTPEEWGATFRSLLTDPGASLAIATAGMKVARDRFGLDAVGQMFLDFYSEVCS